MFNRYDAIHIVCHGANDTIVPVRLSADDHDGRYILFEIWDGSTAISSTGAYSAKLLYTTSDGTGGYKSMTRTTRNGTLAFIVPVPSEVFAVSRGYMAVAVSSGSSVVSTLRIPFTVDGAIIDEDSPEAQDALSEFRDAVARLDQLLPATTTRLGTVMVGDGLSTDGDGVLSVDLSGANFPIVPIDKGGTGQETARAAQHALLGDLAEDTAVASDNTYIVAAAASPSATVGAVTKRKLSNIWTYLLGKIRTAFGFSSSNILSVSNGGTGAATVSAARNALGLGNTDGAVPISSGGTGATTKAAAATAIVNGSAIAPASVAATGAVSGSSIADSGGTLAALRDSVSQVVVRSAPGSSSATAKGQVDAASVGTTYIWGAYSSAAYSPTGAAGNWAYILHVPQGAGVTYSIFFAKAQSHAYIYSYSQDAWTQIV